MFADPQTVTINGTAITLNRTSAGKLTGGFESADGLTDIEISHDRKRRTRHTIRLHSKKSVTDPLVPANSVPVDMSVRLTIDVPPFGYTSDEQLKVVQGLTKFLTDGTAAAVVKIIGNES